MTPLVEIETRGLKAFVTLRTEHTGNIHSINYDTLLQALSKAGVIKGVREDTLSDIAHLPTPGVKFQVADAIPAMTGEDAQLLIQVKPIQRSTYDKGTDADKRVDHYGERAGFITYVQKGQVLAIRKPPTRGACGYTVQGVEIPGIPGKDLILAHFAGRNTTVENFSIIATENGIFNREDGRLHVDQSLKLEGDLGLKTGSILLPLDANIELTIPGDVKSGFAVQCRKIIVYGTVEDARVHAKILDVRRGIVGNSPQPIIADYLTTGFITGHRRIKSRYVQVDKEISGGTIIEADFVRSQIIQECSIIARYAVWTDRMFGCNEITVGVRTDEQQDYNRFTQQLDEISRNLSELKTRNYGAIRKADSLRDMAKRMPNNPKIQEELHNVTELLARIQKGETLKHLLEVKIEQLAEQIYVSGSSFILVTSGFVKHGSGINQGKSINTFTIRDVLYDRANPFPAGLYALIDDEVVPDSRYDLHEIQEIMGRYATAALAGETSENREGNTVMRANTADKTRQPL